MMLFQRLPVRAKIVAVTMLTAMAALLLTGATLFWYESRDFRAKLERELTTLAQVIGANSVAALSFGDQRAASEMLSALRVEPQILVAAIYARPEGANSDTYRILATYRQASNEAVVPETPGPDGFTHVGNRLRYFGPIDDEREHQRLGTIYFETDFDLIRQRGMAYARKLGVVVAASCLMAFALASVLQRNISAPVVKLASTTKRVADTRDYSLRAAQESDDEFGDLAAGFNEMIAQIDTRDRELQKKNAELESANKELDAFSYSVSHDLRAPLRHISGYAGLLQQSDGAAISEKGRKYLDNITNAVRQMGDLIDNLLSFARMGRAEMNLGIVDLQRLAEETVAALQVENPQRKIAWKTGPLRAVTGDRPLLRQVFVNLLSNAVKYTKQREEAEIEIGCRQESDELVIFVRDNGVGFQMEYASKLFGVFQRLHRAEEFEGTGIGLANVRRVISRHGGRTWAEGKPGVGATFYFSLPGEKAKRS